MNEYLVKTLQQYDLIVKLQHFDEQVGKGYFRALTWCPFRFHVVINGSRNKNLQNILPLARSQVSRLIKRLNAHGLIKKDKGSYKYYSAKRGKETTIMVQKIKKTQVIPAFCY